MDRVAQLARRAAKRVPLFPNHRAEVVSLEQWTARNGTRHLVKIVRRVGGKLVEETRPPPYQDPAWLNQCRYKRDWYSKQKQLQGKQFLERQKLLKRMSRQRTGKN
jgi:hypothetical protein